MQPIKPPDTRHNEINGREAVAMVIGKRLNEPHAMYRQDCGWIGFFLGKVMGTGPDFNGSFGLARIVAVANWLRKERGEGPTGAEVLEKIVTAIARGTRWRGIGGPISGGVLCYNYLGTVAMLTRFRYQGEWMWRLAGWRDLLPGEDDAHTQVQFAQGGAVLEGAGEGEPWDLQPGVVGRINQAVADDINALGFHTKPSLVLAPAKTTSYIKVKHGKQLQKGDEKYLGQAIDVPSEVLPNIGEGLTDYRSRSVLLVHKADKDYMAIVEISPGDEDNILWNFWKLKREKSDKYLSKFRQEKTRLLQSGGRPLPHVPHSTPDGEVGKPEGLSGSQIAKAGFYDSTLPLDPENVKPVLEAATTILHVFRNDDDGVESHVAKIDTGYSVVLKDLDSGEIVPTAIVYPTEERAIAKAREIVGVKAEGFDYRAALEAAGSFEDIKAVFEKVFTGLVETTEQKPKRLDPTSMEVRYSRELRQQSVKESKQAGNVHLDQLPKGVESVRGKRIQSIFDGSVGTVTAIDNHGRFYVTWDDEESANHNLGSLETLSDGKKQYQQYTSMVMTQDDISEFRVIPGTRTVNRGIVSPVNKAKR